MNRIYAVLLVIAIFSTVSGVYLLSALSPFSREQIDLLIIREQITREAQLQEELREIADRGLLWSYIDLGHAAVIGLLAGLAIVSSTTLALLGIEHARFRKHPDYRPHIGAALRRGLLLFVGLFSFVVYKLIAADGYLFALTAAFLVIAEALITRFTNPPKQLPQSPVLESTHGNS